MKICPNCRRTYPDDGLNFCLEDGSVLNMMPSEPPATVMMQSLPTNPSPVITGQPGIQTSWDTKPQYSVQPKKSSKAWLLVVGVLGIGLLLCGGGIVGLFFFASMQESSDANSNVIVSNVNKSGTPVPDDRTDVERIDLSNWVRASSDIGLTEFKGGEFFMASKKKGYYYVLVAEEQYNTDSAKTSVTLRNADNMDSSLGYGLIFLSNPKPLTQGYAFLINTKNKKYRVVRHEPQDEIDVVKWTNSTAIKGGSEVNVLTADHKGDQIDLYINDQKVTTIRNVHGYQGGVAGIYSGDAARIAFKNLEIRR